MSNQKLILIVYNTTIHVVRLRLNLIREIQKVGYVVLVLSPVDPYTQVLTKIGIRHIDLRISQYGKSPLGAFMTVLKIWSVMSSVRPAVSLHFTIKPNIFGNIAARLAGVPTVNNVTGAGRALTSSSLVLRKTLTALYRIAFDKTNTVFFQNQDDLNAFLDGKAVAPEKASRIPGSGVDLTRFYPTTLPSGVTRFLFVARLLKEKGIGEFLKAASVIRRQHPDVEVEIAGEIEENNLYIERAVLERTVAESGIKYHGIVSPDRMPDLIRSCTCVVLPSYYGEGVPRTLLEACASGRPIITTDNVGCRDVVDHEVNGFMVPPRDAASLAEAMRRFYALTQDQRMEMAKTARDKAEREFDEKIVIDAYLKTINEIDCPVGERANRFHFNAD